MSTRLLLVGHGRMGRLVESLAPEYGFTVMGVVTSASQGEWPSADVAIDFSVAAAVPSTVGRLAPLGTPIVIGTTGWHATEDEVKRLARAIGVVAAPNFAIGVNIFLAVAERLGILMAGGAALRRRIAEPQPAPEEGRPRRAGRP